jgi:RNA polymerase sigma factor (sigma-70 family)
VQKLYAVLDKMNENYRTALVMTKLEGLAPEQLAQMCGVSAVTVRVRLHRARAQFERLAAEEAGER